MRDILTVLTIAIGSLLLAGCGPAPQPVWNQDSRSFFYTQADGSVLQYDLEKGATRALLPAETRQPVQVALSPKKSMVAFASTGLGEQGRAAQLAIASLPDGRVTWHKLQVWGDPAANRVLCPNSCYWCPTGQRILIWYQQGMAIPGLIQSSAPFGRFAVYDIKSRTLAELTTAPPAVILGQAIHASPLCPDGSGYLAMKLAENGPQFFVVSWDGWEYPLAMTEEVEALLNLLGDPETHHETTTNTIFPLPQGVWIESTLQFDTRSGAVAIDVKGRKITLKRLPENVRRTFEQITATDAAEELWETVQTASFKNGELQLHYRMETGMDGGAVRVDLVDAKLQRRRLLLEGLCPENFLVHHLFPAPDGERILACLKDPQTQGLCIHVIQPDGTVLVKLDTGKLRGASTP